tara:strand:+ start:87 stop:236 length:150 start_codon:yes stop_codon:yes gene_type:complete
MEIIFKIRKENLLYRFKNELEYLSSEDVYFEWTKERIDKLKKIINKYNN